VEVNWFLKGAIDDQENSKDKNRVDDYIESVR
jgi:hypothetical protein